VIPPKDGRTKGGRTKGGRTKGGRTKGGTDAGISRRRVTQVPGQYLGYSLQASRTLDHLLCTDPGSVVSLEVFSDIGVEDADGSVVAEEAKSRTSEGNPIADRAEGLWKTLRNWVEAVQAQSLDARATQFRLWISRPCRGRIAERLNAAKTPEDAKIVMEEARESLMGGAGARESASGGSPDIPERLRSHLEIIFGADPGLVAEVVANFALDFGSGRSLEDLKAVLSRKMVPPEIVDDVLCHALGWVKMRLDSQLERGDPAKIARDEFWAELIAFVRQLDRRDFLASVAQTPDNADIDEHLRFRTYVRQLSLIELNDGDKIRAVTDYLKAETDRVNWAEKGRVIAGSFDAFEGELIGAWKNLRRRCEILHRHRCDLERGQLLYSDCYGHSAKLDGADVPEHFCRGSFHRLADVQIIGWHPRFADLLDG